ncbi:hypothetical protein ACFPM0_20025 [Pseudonocardia sulfidoxydans]|uniref:hypothetical protein n=1 Tax=Pseudonocardia sulfidoxydans TaxID=54011 RepID=UPI00361B719F
MQPLGRLRVAAWTVRAQRSVVGRSRRVAATERRGTSRPPRRPGRGTPRGRRDDRDGLDVRGRGSLSRRG